MAISLVVPEGCIVRQVGQIANRSVDRELGGRALTREASSWPQLSALDEQHGRDHHPDAD